MLSLLMVSLITLAQANTNSVYVEYPKSFQDARQYCKIIFGTDLASIIDDEDRNEAISSIPVGVNDVRIGLYSKSNDGNFRFINDDECPNTDSSFRCVDFWSFRLNADTEERPRCIGDTEGGTQCVTFDAIQNSVDNAIACDEPKPFLCEARIASSYTGQYVYIPSRNPRWTFMTAQEKCESQYGTDLATILTADDLTAAQNTFPPGVLPWAIIGLNDIAVEGQHEWVDGTPCTANLPDGRCSELWNDGLFARDDRSDPTTTANADCVIVSNINFPDNHFEIICDGESDFSWGVLCNAP